ncbi:MAG: hypothetical protein AAGE99_01065 [Chlamydiota bacterium]
MKATSSSSPGCKRFIPLLIGLLPLLFRNPLVAEDSLDPLITKQSNERGDVRPQSEEVEFFPLSAVTDSHRSPLGIDPNPETTESGFYPETSGPDLSYKPYPQQKTRSEPFPLDRETFGATPDLHIKPNEATVVSTRHDPSLEKTCPLAVSFPLQGSTIGTRIDHGAISFNLTAKFDLYRSKKTVNFPKKVQRFHQSSLEPVSPYIYMEFHGNTDEKIHTPTVEKQTLRPCLETVRRSINGAMPLNLKRDDANALAMISGSIQSPRSEISPSPAEFSLDTKVFFVSPSEIPSETFVLPRKLVRFDPPLNRLPFSGRLVESFPSEPEIQGNDGAIGKRFTDDVTASSDYRPSVQKGKKNFLKTFPTFSVPNLQTSLIALETKNRIAIQIGDPEIPFKKFTAREGANLNPRQLFLPRVQTKALSPKTETGIPLKLIEQIPQVRSPATLTERTDRDSTLKADSFDAIHNRSSFEQVHDSRSTYHPLEFPGLNSATATPLIGEKPLEYIKKKIAPIITSPKDVLLPYVVRKKIFPKKAFENLTETDRAVCVANRHQRFPNTREIVEGNPVPIAMQSETAFLSEEFPLLKTDITCSRSKKILEDYHREVLVASGCVALADPELEDSLSDPEKRLLNRSNRLTNGFIAEIPPPSDLKTVSYNNEFETSVHYAEREDGKGYLFSVKMKPPRALNFACPDQHYIFVVDGSSHIKRHRFGVFKEGVGRALSYLEEGDSFNIIIADAAMIPFNRFPTPWNKTSVSKARAFLTDRNYRGFFINYNAFDLLSDIADYFAPDKENIVVLITDGQTLKSLQDHKSDFKKLTKERRGKFSLFTATASHGNNLSMLDLLSVFNNGELMYSKTNAAFSRRLSMLVKHIESFVAGDIHIHVTDMIDETEIAFHPNQKTLPSLYADRPYIVYGSIDRLKDFDLILQGRCGDKWINIKQTISFKDAEKATDSMKKEMALQKAYVCYDYFLKNDDPFFLKEAATILESLHVPTAVR